MKKWLIILSIISVLLLGSTIYLLVTRNTNCTNSDNQKIVSMNYTNENITTTSDNSDVLITGNVINSGDQLVIIIENNNEDIINGELKIKFNDIENNLIKENITIVSPITKGNMYVTTFNLPNTNDYKGEIEVDFTAEYSSVMSEKIKYEILVEDIKDEDDFSIDLYTTITNEEENTFNIVAGYHLLYNEGTLVNVIPFSLENVLSSSNKTTKNTIYGTLNLKDELEFIKYDEIKTITNIIEIG